MVAEGGMDITRFVGKAVKWLTKKSFKEEVVRSIGVCNCYPHVLADLCETVEIILAVNQVERHPFFQQEDALALMKEYKVQPEAWSPFAEGKHGM